MATTSIGCQVPGCTYKAENASEAVAIAMLTSHNNVHQGVAERNRAPKLEPPIIKQDASEEEWQTFEADWTRYKRRAQIPDGDLADELIECCEMSTNNAGLSTYSKNQRKIPDKSDTSKKLVMRAKCQKCNKEFDL